jgi:hypothetical protein
MHPVGPEPASTYWVRRVLVVLVLLLVVVVAWWLLFGRSSGSPDTSGTPPTPSVSSSSPGTTPSDTTSSSPSKTPSNTPSGTASAQDCTNAQIKVKVTTDAPTYPAGQDPKFTLTVTNISDTPCLRDVGSAAEELVVTSGDTRIWSSDDCNPPGTPSVQLLKPGQPDPVTVPWGRTLSQPGCPTGQPAADPGTYKVSGRVGDKDSAPAVFQLT